jgi:microsomal epoxide hydrolase
MSKPYTKLPNEPTIEVKPFEISIPQKDLDDLKVILEHTRIPKETFENSKSLPEGYGVGREWFIKAREAWMAFDWYVPPSSWVKLRSRRKVEKRINEQPQYTAQVKVENDEHTIHFMALFSEREDAVPIIFCNGWPSCFLEFLPLVELVRGQYSPKDLPYARLWCQDS